MRREETNWLMPYGGRLENTTEEFPSEEKSPSVIFPLGEEEELGSFPSSVLNGKNINLPRAALLCLSPAGKLLTPPPLLSSFFSCITFLQ